MSYVVPFPVATITYEEALRALHASLTFGIVPLIETVEDMLAELGNPDLCFRSIQVAGTNGKTSTARYAAAILAAEGLKVALYTSPELVRYTERMEVGGSPVSEEAFAHGLAVAAEAGRRVNARRAEAGERPYDVTEFDTLTVAACVVFAEAEVDVAVLEVGMGGRWDATSAIKSIESVTITGIGLDHMRILGSTLEAIASEKATVIKSGRSCVLGVGTATPASVEDVFLVRAAEQGVAPCVLRASNPADVEGVMHPGEPRMHPELPLTTFAIDQRPRRLGSPMVVSVRTNRATYVGLEALKPSYQAANIACAVALAESFLKRALRLRALRSSVLACPTPGRFDVVRANPLGLVDACHNPQSVGAFLAAMRAAEPKVSERPTLLCAALADKDVEGMVSLLAPEFPQVVVTKTSSPRALAAHELGKLFEARGLVPVAEYEGVREAVGALAQVPFVACGSITTAGEVAACFGR